LSYQIIPSIIFISAILAIILIILRRLPEAANRVKELQITEKLPIEERLINKGLPAIAISKIKVKIQFWIKKTWRFILEAKDLRPTAITGYKIRKIFDKTLSLAHKPKIFSFPTVSNIRDEKYYLDQIKQQPKNLGNYDSLGKFYTQQKNFSDAKDVYLYLVNHDQTHSDYHAKLAYCFYQLQEYEPAVEYYKKSVALDSTHPTRYYNLGLCLSALNKKSEAAGAFQKALEMEPQNEKYRQALNKSTLESKIQIIQ
jgi:tetratricopeptide (TPR) repeat protein